MGKLPLHYTNSSLDWKDPENAGAPERHEADARCFIVPEIATAEEVEQQEHHLVVKAD